MQLLRGRRHTILMADWPHQALGRRPYRRRRLRHRRFDGKYRRYVPSTCSTTGDDKHGLPCDARGRHRACRQRRSSVSDRTRLEVCRTRHSGAAQRPYLTMNNELLGVGQLAAPPEHDVEYQRGYLTGMIRGDGNLDTYRYRRGRAERRHGASLPVGPGRRRTTAPQPGIPPTSAIPTTPLRIHPRHGAAPPDDGYPHISSRHPLTGSDAVIAWPDRHRPKQWRLGYLAGIFDAEGSHSGGILRLSATATQHP